MVSPYTAYSVSIVTANCLEKINLIVAWDSETGLIFIFKIMKKGSIVKGLYIMGILDYIEEEKVVIKYVIHKYSTYFHHTGKILIGNLKTPTKKEKEEYKKKLLKNGYSYYYGKVTKEL